MAYFRQDSSKLPKLKHTLHDIMVNGLEEFPGLVTFGVNRKDDEAYFQMIEDFQRKCTDKAKLRDLPKKQREQQDIIWEIIQSELMFTRHLRVIVDVYLNTLLNLQASVMLNEIETEKIFANISAIEKLHTTFVTQKLSNVIQKAESGKRLPSTFDLVEAFKGWFESIAVPYREYFSRHCDCQRYLRERAKDNEMFRYFLQWGQKHPKSRRLKLTDLLLIPLSRIARYPLLLVMLERKPDRQDQDRLSKTISELKASAVRAIKEASEGLEREKMWKSPEVSKSPRGSKEYSRLSSGGPIEESYDCVSVEEAKMFQLRQALDDIMAHGLQDFSSLLTFSTKRDTEDEDCFKIEGSWRAYLGEEELADLDKKQTDQQVAIWEIIRSEVGFIKDLRVVVDFHLCTLLNLQASMLLNEVETEQIFSNISAIEKLHTRFWKENLSVILKKAQEKRSRLSALDLAKAFEGFTVQFSPYCEFCANRNKCMKYLKQQIRQNNMFKFFIEWVEKHPKSRGLRLQDLLDYPMLHIARYPVLLSEIEESTVEMQEELARTVCQVTEFVKQLPFESTSRYEERGDEETGKQIDSKDHKASVGGPSLDDSSCEYVDEIVTCLVRQDSKLTEFQQMFNDVLNSGLQDFTGLLTFSPKEDDTQSFQIEESWREFGNEETLDGLGLKQIDQQEAMWEIISTEINFIQDIRITEDFYLNTLLNLQASIMLNEIETERLFGNISAIKRAHTRFWKEKLCKVLEKARTKKTILSPVDIAEAFEGFGYVFEPYIEFSSEHSECTKYLEQIIKTNDRFRFFLEWAEKHPTSRCLKLQYLLNSPLQRISEYPLLLTAVETGTLEDGTESTMINRTVGEVKEFVDLVQHESQQEGDKLHRKSTSGDSDSSCQYVDEVTTAQISQDSKLLRLQETLDDLMVNGLQDFQGLLRFGSRREDRESSLPVEETWRAFVKEEELFSTDKKQMDQQAATWEIIRTEADFIRDIRITVDLYLCTLLNVQAAMLLNEIQTEKIFGNISAIEELHTKFWKQKLSGIVSNARDRKELPSASDLAEAFDGFPRLFTPYARFCSARSKCLEYLREQIGKNRLFRTTMEWAERHPDSRGLKLQDLMDLPLHRIAKYPILLAALENSLDEQDKTKVSERVSKMKEFVVHVSRLSTPVANGQSKVDGKEGTPTLARKKALRHHSTPEEDRKMLELKEVLDDFMTEGVQDFSVLLAFSGKGPGDDGWFCIGESWRSLGGEEQGNEMDKRREVCQDAIWEVITSEIGFIQDLCVVEDVYLSTLINLQASIMLNEIETERLFGNISTILGLHKRFWKDRLSKVVTKAQNEKRFPSATDLIQAFEGFSNHFAPYTHFFATQKEGIKYLNEQIVHNKMFRFYLGWAEKHPKSRGMGPQVLLESPIRHLAKYSSLLFRVAETLDEEDKIGMSKILSQVKDFVARVSDEKGLLSKRQEPAEQVKAGEGSNSGEAVAGQGTNPSSEYVEEIVTALIRKDSNMVKLRKTLDEFKIYGLQDFPALLTFTTKREDEEWFHIEESWSEFVDQEGAFKLDERTTSQQEATWKIITTEVSFLRDIRIIVDLYLCTLLNLQAAILLNEVKTENLFSNITTLEKRHSRFWKEKLSHVIWKARTEKRPPSTQDLADAFDGFEAIFKPYVTYCTVKNKCLKYLDEQNKNNEMFRFFVEWVERNPESRGLKLHDLLDLPVKRIAEYPTLLTEVLERTPDGQERAALSRKVAEIKVFLMQVPFQTRQDLEEAEEGMSPLRRTASEGTSKMHKLKQTLHDFMANGLQDFPRLLTFSAKRESDEDCFRLETSWRDLVENNNLSELEKEQTTRQEAMWDIISTEVSRVRDCRVVVDLYLCTLLNLQANGLLNEIQTEKLFSNVTAIEKLHTRFWKERLSYVVERARAEKRLLTVVDLAKAFEGFAKLFAPYVKFCSSNKMCQKYLMGHLKQDDMFKVYVEWVEKHPDSLGLKLRDFLFSPTQHIYRYSRLLGVVEKTLSVNDQDGTVLSARTSQVQDFLKRLQFLTQKEGE
ncbi:uncharacterized protein LOC110984578 [Acanthaster planci]|uniref:Uncharacterized protein LOC110984578 n=1 Tax=Acanthaster planci TaxID=133434 RepID=A0A8B7Z4N6_ACAPL|nr:uncharacterized protein LOC110984578 [Acanthaster planci]XP_022100598.1 uncharacterized protein LOC110984578 [Acanthaster planci]XP_022100599.1 uncharacterized protein LOC110984578 [Acanthaster planci]XP_022100600.1 uncharacterized protein LOC110984578 [Acanthaster planci]